MHLKREVAGGAQMLTLALVITLRCSPFIHRLTEWVINFYTFFYAERFSEKGPRHGFIYYLRYQWHFDQTREAGSRLSLLLRGAVIKNLLIATDEGR